MRTAEAIAEEREAEAAHLRTALQKAEGQLRELKDEANARAEAAGRAAVSDLVPATPSAEGGDAVVSGGGEKTGSGGGSGCGAWLHMQRLTRRASPLPTTAALAAARHLMAAARCLLGGCSATARRLLGACSAAARQLPTRHRAIARYARLDTQIGEFVLTHPDVRIPDRGAIYSFNEANSNQCVTSSPLDSTHTTPVESS